MVTKTGVLNGWKDIAQYLGCTEITARAYRKTEKLPVKKVKGKVMITVAMIERWLECKNNA